MTWFDVPTPWAKIFAVMKDKSQIQIKKERYEEIKSLGWHSVITLENDKGHILFEWRRSEIERFQHVYPEEKKEDTYMINSQVYKQEKAKRDAFWKWYHEKMTQEQKDETWSIIYSRWGKSYKLEVDIGHGLSWKSYFRWMFPIISLELCGYRDKLSSENWIIAEWIPNMELPELYGDTDKFRNLVKNAKEAQVSELQEGSEESQTQ